MNHYPHHIGDFNNGTRHLTRIERSIYRDLIELYYDTEAPLTSDIDALARRIIARSEEEMSALVAVLGEFFQLQDGVYRHGRCDEEIAKYQAFAENGKQGAAKRWKKPSDSPPINPPLAKNSPPIISPLATRTNNQEPIYTPLPPKGEEVEVKAAGRDHAKDFTEFWDAYPENRKKNRYRSESAWSAARHHLPPQNELLGALAAFKSSFDWRREDGKYIPSPWVWLEERRWQDAPAHDPKASKPKPKNELDEEDAFRWRAATYPDSIKVHPTPASFPTKMWSDSIRKEYLASKKQPQLQAA